jgi:hypothetical protein
MRNLSFSSRLFVLTATLLAASVVVGVIGIVGLGRTNAGLETVYNDRVIPLRQLKQIADAYAVSVIDAANKANAGLMSAEETRAAVTAAQGVIASNWKAYMATTREPPAARGRRAGGRGLVAGGHGRADALAGRDRAGRVARRDVGVDGRDGVDDAPERRQLAVGPRA